MSKTKTNRTDPTQTQKDRFKELTNEEPKAAKVKQYFKVTKNLAFYNRLAESHHGSSLEFWTIAVARIEASTEIYNAGHRVVALSPKNLELMNFLLNLGFRIDTTTNVLNGLDNFPRLVYTFNGQKTTVTYREESDCGIELSFTNGVGQGFEQQFSSDRSQIFGVYRLAKFLIEYVIPLRVKAINLASELERT